MPRLPNKISKSEQDSLKELLLKASPTKIERPADCELLSEDIFKRTEKYLSVSTLKRFLGFHPSDFKPSMETTRIINEYLLSCKKLNNIRSSDLIIDFFNPLNHETIREGEPGLQAATRKVALNIRSNEILFSEVMIALAESPTGRKYYYELYPDYEILSKFQYKGYECYLRHEKSYEGQLFGHCILFLKHFFDRDLVQMKAIWIKIKSLYLPKKKLHPFVHGRYYQTMLIGCFFFNPKEAAKFIKRIFQVEAGISRQDSGLFKEFPGFHYFVCDGLFHAQQFGPLLELSDIALREFKKHKEFIWKGYYDQLKIYKAWALFKLGQPSKSKKLIRPINPSLFYFISASYYQLLLEELKEEINKTFFDKQL